MRKFRYVVEKANDRKNKDLLRLFKHISLIGYHYFTMRIKQSGIPGLAIYYWTNFGDAGLIAIVRDYHDVQAMLNAFIFDLI